MKTFCGITFDEIELENSLNGFLQKPANRNKMDEFFTDKKIIKALDNDDFDTVFSRWINISFSIVHLSEDTSFILSEILLSSGIDFLSYMSNIGWMMFSKNNYLTSITIPENVKSISDYAFYDCKSLTSVIIPDSVTSINTHAFFCCESLESITIPNHVTKIDDYAFYFCKSLKSVTISNSVTWIGTGVFFRCDKLKEINYSGTKAEWEKIRNFTAWCDYPMEVNCTDGVIKYENN